MLTELRIENFAIIQQLVLEPKSGLTIFTGETGAGKSIILDAIEAVIGGKADATLIRAGAERALVEATFRLPREERDSILEILRREELLDDENVVTLAREMRREGRSTARVNGRAVSASLLRELGSYLVDIHGQSEHLSLLNVHQHIALLDRYANHTGLLSAYRQVYQHLTSLRRELQALRQTEQEAERRVELLTFQLQEIESANLLAGEEDEQRAERNRLANAESLALLTQQCLQVLEEGTPEAPGLSDLLGQLVSALSSLSRLDPSKARLYEQGQTVADLADDLSRDLRDYQDQIEFNPRRLEQIEERLALIHNLKRKYGGSIEAVLVYATDARQKLDQINHAGERIAELGVEELNLLTELGRCGQVLSTSRCAAAENMAQGVEGELVSLSMPGAHFKVSLEFTPTGEDGVLLPDGSHVKFFDTGLDKVEFLIAPNLGEGFKPMVRIASGGETSRLMLALKNVLAIADYIPTLIFDEIDQGIGGRVGVVVGEKLWQLGRAHQVFCVTHLPQLAAFGDQHYRVAKQLEAGRTLTLVQELDTSTRPDELAQMLGGVTDANRRAAQEALQLAHQRAVQLGAPNN